MIISLFLINLVFAIRINEVELNPTGTDSNDEWIELYSNTEVDLNGWKLVNNDDDELELDQVFNGYLIIELDGQWLDNSNERVFLYEDETLIDETELFDDPNNDDKTWQYCNGEWNFTTQTRDSENECHNSNDENNETEIILELEWDEDDIVNGKDFEIKVKVENLDDQDYDVKLWIEDEDDKIISERYDKEEEKWKSGNYYINEFFSGPGDETEDIELRIKDEYEDYEGDAKIYLKLRPGGEIDEDIEILEKKKPKTTSNEEEDEEEVIDNEPSPITEQVIQLGSSISESIGSKTEDLKERGDMVYESKDNKIKEYAIIGFAFFCVGLSVLLIFNKIK
tara:strand:+ start:101 stop:1117 length:1017 start_codon:yes stop_codon:yes gene_type:complete